MLKSDRGRSVSNGSPHDYAVVEIVDFCQALQCPLSHKDKVACCDSVTVGLARSVLYDNLSIWVAQVEPKLVATNMASSTFRPVGWLQSLEFPATVVLWSD